MKNEYEFCGDVGVIYVDRDGEERVKIFVDAKDLIKISTLKKKVYISKNGYAKIDIDSKSVFLHRYLTKCPEGFEVDHINRKKLDNRQKNLRILTHAENLQNRAFINKKHSSKYRGVVYHSLTGGWKAEATVNGKTTSQIFYSEIEAANFAKKLRKELMPYATN